ncbi:hypothetical protein QZM22_27260 [Burkholderia oklahomensis]|uniref:hypothetical protein n=1 Tax=Burkholderia oklahomensis TaxID=342113 RepID=UPI00265166AC|nr:hypothetical protein [Burkholderia oklahomensis]MDN7676092.1 hypothetical protein [Burkholderia oklahomensis]
MGKLHLLRAHTKVFYRPIEAAIRWTGLLRFEQRILRVLKQHNGLPEHADFPRWSQLCLNLERLRDALVNRDLPYDKNNITCDDASLLDTPDLTIRHVDLKAWMIRFYPSSVPLFSSMLSSAIFILRSAWMRCRRYSWIARRSSSSLLIG